MAEPLSDEELDTLELLSTTASPAPWFAWLESEGVAGQSMIAINLPGDFPPDMYVYHDGETAPDADLRFIAAARNLVPRLIAELRARRADG